MFVYIGAEQDGFLENIGKNSLSRSLLLGVFESYDIYYTEIARRSNFPIRILLHTCLIRQNNSLLYDNRDSKTS